MSFHKSTQHTFSHHRPFTSLLKTRREFARSDIPKEFRFYTHKETTGRAAENRSRATSSSPSHDKNWSVVAGQGANYFAYQTVFVRGKPSSPAAQSGNLQAASAAASSNNGTTETWEGEPVATN
ncbi:hypothetical protein L596_015566 [Steinernema carpocapsae]|uniref:Uncharacterized protein n=1 Tax=Steinernema carpocapsae TaxID=34508 RepID=A0A4U5NG96_STECR|nr:hypothetical protein L596_015566 [Steinernema carpocapsae]